MLEGLRKELEGIKLDDPKVVKLIEDFGLVELEEGEELLGVADEEAIKLKVLVIQLDEQIKQMTKDHEAAHQDPRRRHDPEFCQRFNEELGRLTSRAKCLEKLFWGAITLDHNLFDVATKSVVIRKGWQVVKSKPKPEEAMGAMIEVVTMSGPEGMAELLSMMGGNQPSKPRRRGFFSGGRH